LLEPGDSRKNTMSPDIINSSVGCLVMKLYAVKSYSLTDPRNSISLNLLIIGLIVIKFHFKILCTQIQIFKKGISWMFCIDNAILSRDYYFLKNRQYMLSVYDTLTRAFLYSIYWFGYFTLLVQKILNLGIQGIRKYLQLFRNDYSFRNMDSFNLYCSRKK
jgi:hypothetical protein